MNIATLIKEIPSTHVPIELLLDADPSEAKIRTYLSKSKCFAISSHGTTLGVCVVKPLDEVSYEIMSIAIQPKHQKCGLGTGLLKWVVDFYRKLGAAKLIVGTGTFGYQLAFYQRQGFRATSIVHNFFITNYSEPIFEEGIQLFDMLMLTLNYSSQSDDIRCQP